LQAVFFISILMGAVAPSFYLHVCKREQRVIMQPQIFCQVALLGPHFRHDKGRKMRHASRGFYLRA